MDVGGSETELARSWVQLYVLGVVGGDELFGDCLGAVGGAVVDDYEFPVEIAVGLWLS